jgi:hypothetical protein
VKIRVSKICPNETDVAKDIIEKLAARRVRAGNIAIREIRACEVGPREVSIREIVVSEYCT